MTYDDFLASKVVARADRGREAGEVHPSLFPFQAAIVRWAVARGRCAIFADTGLGKTRMQLEWARQMGGRCLIVAPLGVTAQTIAEGERIGITVRLAAAAKPNGPAIYITNYEKLHRFDPSVFDAVVLDESSILKSIDGKTRQRLIAEWTMVPLRLCCTATPAPNDLEELANHSEFLGAMTRPEMLATYFVHDERIWRLKGHAREPFFRWMASWAMYVRKPSDLGFGDEGFVLPELNIVQSVVPLQHASDDALFPALESGIRGRHVARRASLNARVERAAELICSRPGQWLVWCGLNDEQDSLARKLGADCVSIDGRTFDEEKLRLERLWREGGVRVLLTKACVFGFGMNWQHCRHMAFLGLGDSWEQYYQAIRRCWRFGQREAVDVVIVTSDAEGAVVENVWRKEREAQDTAAEVITYMRDTEREALGTAEAKPEDYATGEASGPEWRMLLGDCIERLREIAEGAVGLSVHSPPFAALYVYSASMRDLGNSRDYEQFFEHYRFVVRELLRVTASGRRAAVHVQQVTTTKTTHGVIGWRDFRADVVRLYQTMGWVYDGEIVIDKDPQAQAIRTKSKALLFVQKERDASWLRPAMADYILLFRAPGENVEPIRTDVSNDEWIRWARPIWYGIRETATLQAAAARTERDEKHIAPLQLETIERCVRLWSNRGDLVLDPMAGIGSTGYVALRHGRRFVGIELKPEYWQLACSHLRTASAQEALPLGLASDSVRMGEAAK